VAQEDGGATSAPAPDADPLSGQSLLVTLGFSLLLLYPFWRIFRRAGFTPWYSLLVLVPYVGLPTAAALLALFPWPAGESRRAGGRRG
jgi:hypothetical protein